MVPLSVAFPESLLLPHPHDSLGLSFHYPFGWFAFSPAAWTLHPFSPAHFPSTLSFVYFLFLSLYHYSSSFSRASLYFLTLPRSSLHFHALHRTSMHFIVLPHTTLHFHALHALPRTSSKFVLLLSISCLTPAKREIWRIGLETAKGIFSGFLPYIDPFSVE